MTSQPGASLHPDDLIVAGYELDLEDSWHPKPLTVATPEQAAHINEILTRGHVEDWDALHSCSCYTQDRCMMDTGCPFAVNCLAAED